MMRRVNLAGPPQTTRLLQLPSSNDVGKIIGKGGSRIRELQNSTGAKLFVDRNALTVSITGTETQVEGAAGAVAQLLATGQGERRLRNLTFITRHCIEALGGFDNIPGVTTKLDRGDLLIVAEDESRLDAAVDEIQGHIQAALAPTQWTCQINSPDQLQAVMENKQLNLLATTASLVMQSYTGESVGMKLSGPKFVVNQAQVIVESLLNVGGAAYVVPTLGNFIQVCDSAKLESLKLDIAQHVEQRFNCRAMLTPTVCIIGAGSRLIEAVRWVVELLIYYFPDNCALYTVVPEQAVGGLQLDRLQHNDCCCVELATPGEVWLCGQRGGVQRLGERLSNCLAQWKRTHAIVEFSGPRGRIIGPGGNRLRQLEELTGSKLTCQEYYLLVECQEENLENAVQLLRGTIN